MSSTFSTAERSYFTSESVTEGHPDKVCDQISDAVLDAVLKDDPDGHVACETATTTGVVLVFGEITTSTYVDIPALVRDVVRDIGYTHAAYGFDCKTCGVIVSIKEQSPEIAGGVEHGARSRASKDTGRSVRPDRRRRPGHDDRLRLPRDRRADAAADLPRAQALPAVCPRRASTRRSPGCARTAKAKSPSSTTTGNRMRVDTVVVSTQHADDVSNDRIRADVERVHHPPGHRPRSASTPRRSSTSIRAAASRLAGRWPTLV